MRDRLIELIAKSGLVLVDGGIHPDTHIAQEALADHLLAAGVIVPPCKVGDVVYGIYRSLRTDEVSVFKYDVTEIMYGSRRGVRPWIVRCFGGRTFDNCDFGKTVFLTKEEAERALAERREK